MFAYIAKITRTSVTREGRKYVYYRVKVPNEIVEKLRKEMGIPDDLPIPVKVIISPPSVNEIITEKIEEK